MTKMNFWMTPFFIVMMLVFSGRDTVQAAGASNDHRPQKKYLMQVQSYLVEMEKNIKELAAAIQERGQDFQADLNDEIEALEEFRVEVNQKAESLLKSSGESCLG
jgi:peptidoglycan hydrolase CwlO-like protein